MKASEVNKNFWKTPSEVFGCRRKSGLFGIELELEGINLPAHGIDKKWNVHREQNILGFEYVTLLPLRMDAVRAEVQALEKHIEQSRGAVRNGYKAGTHIHLNVCGEPFLNIFGIIAVFALIESVMLRMCGPDRDGNHFCISGADCGDLPMWLGDTARNVSRGNWNWKPRGKYAALNTDPVGCQTDREDRPKGSLEFRFFPASIDPMEIEKFCRWLYNLKNLVRECEDKSFMSLLDMAREQPYVFVSRIIPEINRKQFPVTSIEEGVLFGVENAYEILRVLKKALLSEAKEQKEELRIVDDVVIEPNGGWGVPEGPGLQAGGIDLNGLVMRNPIPEPPRPFAIKRRAVRLGEP